MPSPPLDSYSQTCCIDPPRLFPPSPHSELSRKGTATGRATISHAGSVCLEKCSGQSIRGLITPTTQVIDLDTTALSMRNPFPVLVYKDWLPDTVVVQYGLGAYIR